MHLVETIPGKGTFVTKAIEPFVTDLSPQTGDGGEKGLTYPSMVREHNREGRASQPRDEVTRCPQEVARLLRVSLDTGVISRSQERYIDGEPWSLQTSYYPMKWCHSGALRLLQAQDIPEGTISYLNSSLGLKQVRYEDWITARSVKEDEAQWFGVPHNAAMFLIYRTGFTADGTPIRVTVTLYPADRNQFRYRFEDLPDNLPIAGWAPSYRAAEMVALPRTVSPS
jgi:GntR family transcriptional regulator